MQSIQKHFINETSGGVQRKMILIYIIIIMVCVWFLISLLMLLIKIIISIYEFYTDLKQITKKRG